MNKIAIVKSEVQFFESNDAGYQYQIVLTVLFDNKKYDLIYQAKEPEYLSQPYLEREQDGRTTGAYALDRATGDDSDSLANAITGAFDAFAVIDAATRDTVRRLSEEI